MSDRAPLEAAEESAKKLGRLIGETCPPGWLFALVLASKGEAGFMTYISNANRPDMITLLRETADRIERNEPDV